MGKDDPVKTLFCSALRRALIETATCGLNLRVDWDCPLRFQKKIQLKIDPNSIEQY